METLLRRQLWLVDSAAIAIAAILTAHAVATAGAGWGARGNQPSPGAWPAARTHQVDAAPAKSIDDILRRHIFCSNCPPGGALMSAAPHPADHRGARPTALAMRLIAVMYAPVDRRWSLAIIRDDDARTTVPAILGSPVRDATIDRIDQTRVYLDFGAGRREFLDLLAQPPAAGAAVKSPAPTGAAGASAAPLRDGIRRTGERQYEVRRATLETWLGNLPLLAGQGRFIPEIRDGKGAGIRLLSVRPEGPFAALGLRHGDVIAAINGLELNSPDQALDAYLKLRLASHISLAIERDGHRLNQEYDIR